MCAYMLLRICVHEYLLVQCSFSTLYISDCIIRLTSKVKVNLLQLPLKSNYTFILRDICYHFIKSKGKKRTYS